MFHFLYIIYYWLLNYAFNKSNWELTYAIIFVRASSIFNFGVSGSSGSTTGAASIIIGELIKRTNPDFVVNLTLIVADCCKLVWLFANNVALFPEDESDTWTEFVDQDIDETLSFFNE